MLAISALSITLLSLAPLQADAFVRMSCGSRLVDERIDPIANPGEPASHAHAVNGGNGFNFTQEPGLIRRSTCSSCPIKEDLSAYWTPKLYFHNTTDDTFKAVDQAGDYDGALGGQTVYYLQRGGPNNDKLKAYPEGFRMIAGDTLKRNYTGGFDAQAISFNCLDYNGGGNPETNNLPDKQCPDGLRAQVFFPSCWDGKNLDSPDHRSHMAYPIGAYNSGSCPASHPVHMISIFFEIIYSTDKFADGWYNGNKQPFVFSNGDPTGYGFHGDFLNGWDVPTLQALTDDCTNLSGVPSDCNKITFFTDEEMSQCKIPRQIHEPLGIFSPPLAQLPGCNPLTYGPGPATPVANCDRKVSIGAFATSYTDLSKSKGYKYLGCAPDTPADRTFTSPMDGDDAMTLEKCIDYCAGKGYSIAGAEYGTQCFCSNSIRSDRQPTAGAVGSCAMKCGGDSSQYCGGAGGLSLYQKCADGEACANAGYTAVN